MTDTPSTGTGLLEGQGWRAHLLSVLFMLLVSYIYFAPLLTGERVYQYDWAQWAGTAREQLEYVEQHDGEQSLWTSTVFGGMPTTLVSLRYPGNILSPIDSALTLGVRPASYLFLLLVGFYFLLHVVGVRGWITLAGALAYGFSTYFFIVVGAGHNAKLHAMCYVAPMIAGVIMAYRGRYLAGGGIFALMLGLGLVAGHPQITYYGFFIIAALAIGYLMEAIRGRAWRKFLLASLALLVGMVLAVGANFNRLYQVWDYGKESIRTASELSSMEAANHTGGLDRDYALDWSYGVGETLNMLVPNLYGGSSSYKLATDSYTAEALRKLTGGNEQIVKQYIEGGLPLYWGPQPMTSGPVYVGALVIFLFIFSIFTARGGRRIALLAVTLLAILLAWGKHAPALSNLFLDFFPGYNKFRTVSMILVIAQLTIPLLAFDGVSRWLRGDIPPERVKKAVLWTPIVYGALLLLILVVGLASFSFTGSSDAQMVEGLKEGLMNDRRALFEMDVFRGLFLGAIPALLALMVQRKRIRVGVFALAMVGLVLFDMWPINKRYDGVRYVAGSMLETPFQPSAADRAIMKDTSYYRVLNTTVSPFNDASTSYFHRSVGGYHGAKLRRFQDFVDHYAQSPVFINLLNTKYVIQPSQEYGAMPAINRAAYGSAWLVSSIFPVESAMEEMEALGKRDLRHDAVIDRRAWKELPQFGVPEPGDTITLAAHEPNRMLYNVKAAGPRLALFSEIYYPKGWRVWVDGKEATIGRADYLLRALPLPAGEYQVEMRFDLPTFHTGKYVDAASGILLILALVGAGFVEWKRCRSETNEPESQEKRHVL